MHIIYTKKTLLAILPIIFLALFFVRNTHAQEGNILNLTTSPIFYDFTNDPGEKVSDKIRIRNNSDTSVNLKVEIKRISSTSEAGEANIENLRPEDEFDDWIEFSKTRFTAPSKEWTDVPFTIKIPSSAAFGYYFAFAITQDAPESQGDQPRAQIQGSIAIPVLLTVRRDDAKVEGKIVEFKAENYITEYMPVNFITKFENTGNLHIRPRGNIFIRGRSDKEIAILEVNQEQGAILPNGTRSFNSSWKDGFITQEPIIEDGVYQKDDKGNTKTRLTINWNKLTDFRIGPYTAYMLSVYDDGTQDVQLEATTTFWVLPYKVIIGGIVAVIIVILVLRFILRSYINTQLKKRR